LILRFDQRWGSTAHRITGNIFYAFLVSSSGRSGIPHTHLKCWTMILM